MLRKAVRRPRVLEVTGWSKSTLGDKIAAGKFPKPIKLDPEGRAVIWWEDQLVDWQKAVTERQQGAA